MTLSILAQLESIQEIQGKYSPRPAPGTKVIVTDKAKPRHHSRGRRLKKLRMISILTPDWKEMLGEIRARCVPIAQLQIALNTSEYFIDKILEGGEPSWNVGQKILILYKELVLK